MQLPLLPSKLPVNRFWSQTIDRLRKQWCKNIQNDVTLIVSQCRGMACTVTGEACPSVTRFINVVTCVKLISPQLKGEVCHRANSVSTMFGLRQWAMIKLGFLGLLDSINYQFAVASYNGENRGSEAFPLSARLTCWAGWMPRAPTHPLAAELTEASAHEALTHGHAWDRNAIADSSVSFLLSAAAAACSA